MTNLYRSALGPWHMCNVSCLTHSPSRVEAKKIDSMRISGAFLSFLCFATLSTTRLQASPRLQQSGRSALEPRYSYNIKPNLWEELHNVAVSWAETFTATKLEDVKAVARTVCQGIWNIQTTWKRLRRSAKPRSGTERSIDGILHLLSDLLYLVCCTCTRPISW